MKFAASEQGTQFDRYGALWIGDIEVLRTTTAEPTPDGITWSFEKDLTVYGNYFKSTSPLYTLLSIPNNIDSTYTGVIFVEVSLTFYVEESDTQAEKSVVEVLPLTKAPTNGKE